MPDLRFAGVSDDGGFVLLTDEHDQQFRVPLDKKLRDALRPRTQSRTIERESLPQEFRPRDIQSLLRGGGSATDVAEVSGWSVDKVQRYEGPIRAERDYLAQQARAVPIRTRVDGKEVTSSIGDRVTERLAHRGVGADEVSWDAWKGEQGWQVVCRFHAGGRDRVATWSFDPAAGGVHPEDDEGRWLTEDEQSDPPTAQANTAPESNDTVYDVVADGGLLAGQESTDRPAGAVRRAPAPAPAARSEHPVDLVSVMRERSKNRRRSRGTAKSRGTSPEDHDPQGPSDSTPVDPAQSGAAASDAAPGDARSAAPSPAAPGSGADEQPASPEDTTQTPPLGHDPVTGTADLFADLPATPEDAPVDPADGSAAADLESETAQDQIAPPTADSTPSADTPPAEATTTTKPAPDEGKSVGTNSDSEEEPATPDSETTPDSDQTPDSDDESEAAEAEDSGKPAVPSRPSAARSGRPSVPSWDDIMFGRRRD